MAESLITKTLRDVTVRISDLAGLNSVEVVFEVGDFTLDVPRETINQFPDRGRFTSPPSLRLGDDQPMTGSWTFNLRDVSDATDEMVSELIFNSGAIAANWVSTLGALAEVPVFTIRWTAAGIIHGDAQDHFVECEFCAIRGSFGDGHPEVYTLNFVSYDLEPTVQ